MIVNNQTNVKKICKDWGIGLIIAGIIAFLFPNTLSTSFGIFAILLGVIALVFRAKWVIAMIGAVIVLVGAWNIIIVLIYESQYGFLILGIVQVLIGIGALNEYHNIIEGKNISPPKSNKTFKKGWEKQKTWEKVIIIFGIIIVGLMLLGLIEILISETL